MHLGVGPSAASLGGKYLETARFDASQLSAGLHAEAVELPRKPIDFDAPAQLALQSSRPHIPTNSQYDQMPMALLFRDHEIQFQAEPTYCMTARNTAGSAHNFVFFST